jgi:hypothetical protein
MKRTTGLLATDRVAVIGLSPALSAIVSSG